MFLICVFIKFILFIIFLYFSYILVVLSVLYFRSSFPFSLYLSFISRQNPSSIRVFLLYVPNYVPVIHPVNILFPIVHVPNIFLATDSIFCCIFSWFIFIFYSFFIRFYLIFLVYFGLFLVYLYISLVDLFQSASILIFSFFVIFFLVFIFSLIFPNILCSLIMRSLSLVLQFLGRFPIDYEINYWFVFSGWILKCL